MWKIFVEPQFYLFLQPKLHCPKIQLGSRFFMKEKTKKLNWNSTSAMNSTVITILNL